MSTPFDAYANTARGQRLAAIINDTARYPEYRCFSREGWPAVTAIVSLVSAELQPLRKSDSKEFAAAKQFVGWVVGQVMRQHGHQIVGRARVSGRLERRGGMSNMAKTAVGELQQQIEEVRREAFATAYGAAMQAIRELASRPLPGDATPSRTRRGRARPGRKSAAATPVRRRRARPGDGATRTRRAVARRPQRGTNAQSVQEVLQAAAPRPLRPAEIRMALQDKGTEMAFTSIRHALGQLEARRAAEQVGNSRTWRYCANGS